MTIVVTRAPHYKEDILFKQKSKNKSSVNTVPADLTVTLLRCENHSLCNKIIRQEKNTSCLKSCSIPQDWAEYYSFLLLFSKTSTKPVFATAVDTQCKLWLFSTLKDVGRISTK